MTLPTTVVRYGSEVAQCRDDAVAMGVRTSVYAAHPESRPIPNVAGYLATAGVVGLGLLLVLTWPVGAIGDVLLVAALAGLLFRIPHTVPVWAALTLLALTAVALSVNSAAVAESLANYAYYGLAVGCLWAIWNLAAERFCWNMPATTVVETVVRRRLFMAMPVRRAAFVVVLLAISATIAKVSEPAAVPLVAIALWGIVWRPRYLFILCCAATLLALANLFFLVGNRALAVRADLLAAEAFGVAVVWLGWRALGKSLARRFPMRMEGDIGSDMAIDEATSPPASDEKVASV